MRIPSQRLALQSLSAQKAFKGVVTAQETLEIGYRGINVSDVLLCESIQILLWVGKVGTAPYQRTMYMARPAFGKHRSMRRGHVKGRFRLRSLDGRL